MAFKNLKEDLEELFTEEQESYSIQVEAVLERGYHKKKEQNREKAALYRARKNAKIASLKARVRELMKQLIQLPPTIQKPRNPRIELSPEKYRKHLDSCVAYVKKNRERITAYERQRRKGKRK